MKESRGRLVIVVDDDQAVLASMIFSLDLEGFETHTFRSGEELLGSDEMPERGCLVIDYKLPGMNGLELLDELRHRGVTLPALLVTGSPSRSLLQEAGRAGVAIVEKPFMSNALVDAIRSAVVN